MTPTGTDAKSDEVGSATLLHFAGPEALEIYNTFTWTEEGDKKKIYKILENFEEYCTPRKNITWERHIFNTRAQKLGENIDQYTTDLRKKATSCEFGILRNSLIRDRIVCGIHDDRTRSRLLKEADLTLARAIDICRADEITASQIKVMANPSIKPTEPELGLQLIKSKNRAARRIQQYIGGVEKTTAKDSVQHSASTEINVVKEITSQVYASLPCKRKHGKRYKQYKTAAMMIMILL